MTRPIRIAVCCVLASCLLLAPAHADEANWNKRLQTFKRALVSKDPKTRARAFDLLREARTPDAMDAIVKGVKTVEAEFDRIRQDQKAAEALYEKLINDLHDAQATFEQSNRSSRDLERYNKRERKISKARDGAIKKLKNLENDFTRSRAMVQQAVLVAAEILEALNGEAKEDALARLNAQWLQAKEVEDQLRWVHAVAQVQGATVTAHLNGVVDEAQRPTAIRIAAMGALAGRKDGTILGKAIGMLTLPPAEATMVLAAIRTLRQLHDRRGIAPLIGFLARDDLKRERGDAHEALLSLTGQTHGPYPGEWKKWWAEAEAGFVMPADPRPTGDTKQPDKGTTFYGIHTFSDRVLFIVDISGSMDKKQKGQADKTKMAICKEELISAVFKLDDGAGFNVILFNHQVIPWQARKQEANQRTKKMLQAWVESQEPLGGTNIYDAIEAGFKVAVRTTGRADLDTIFFLTDGKPTAGKIQDADKILDVIREWNLAANLKIHCIGIGMDHDVEFMKELARIGSGRYVSTVAVPDIHVDVTSLDFGEVKLGESATRTVTLGNTGNGTCRVEELTFEVGGAQFRAAADSQALPFAIERGQTVEIKIEYRPQGTGEHRGRLRILSNDASDPKLPIECQGVCVP